MKEWTRGMMSAMFEFSKNPKWPTYGLFCVTFLTISTCSALYFRYQGLNCFHIWESESMDIIENACLFEIFFKIQNGRLSTHFSFCCINNNRMSHTVFQISSLELFRYLGSQKKIFSMMDAISKYLKNPKWLMQFVLSD